MPKTTDYLSGQAAGTLSTLDGSGAERDENANPGFVHPKPSELVRLVTLLISSEIGIRPEQVTTEFIHVWREENLYPRAHVELGASFNGYRNVLGRRALTAEEILDQSKRARAFFSSLTNGKRELSN